MSKEITGKALQNLKDLIENQQPLDPETAEAINENFWDMYGPIGEEGREGER